MSDEVKFYDVHVYFILFHKNDINFDGLTIQYSYSLKQRRNKDIEWRGHVVNAVYCVLSCTFCQSKFVFIFGLIRNILVH